MQDEVIPVEGTIYYENENENTLYVTQSGDETEQYRFNTVIADENEQEWDNSQQSIEQNIEGQDEDSEQVNIYISC